MPIDGDHLLKPFIKVRKSLKKIPNNPSPEQIHKLRTRMRRIEATLDALGLVLPNGERVLRQEKPFRRRAGKIRDMDVLTGLAGSLVVESGDESRVELLEYLGEQRYRQAHKLRVAARIDGPKFRSELQRRVARLETHVGDKASTKAKAEAAAAVTARAVALSRQLSTYPRLSRTNLHEFRLQVKHLRYILQMATDGDTEFVHALGEVKDKIGEWHDWQQLTEVAREIAPNGSSRLLKLLTTTTNAKYEYALRLSQQFRNRYLAGSKSGKRAHATVISAPAVVTNVLMAA
jgi:CHAD domain-containing protein